MVIQVILAVICMILSFLPVSFDPLTYNEQYYMKKKNKIIKKMQGMPQDCLPNHTNQTHFMNYGSNKRNDDYYENLGNEEKMKAEKSRVYN